MISVFLYQILAYTVHGKIQKSFMRKINLRYQLQHWMKNLDYLLDHILYQIFKTILNIYLKKHGEKTANPSIRIYINKIENRITYKIKTAYYLELLIPETMEWLGSTQRKITKNENGENVPHLEITEVVLIQCNIVNDNYHQNSRVLYTFIPNKSFAKLLDILPKYFIFLKTFDSKFSYIEVWFTHQNSKNKI